jgi:hypothetical protein
VTNVGVPLPALPPVPRGDLLVEGSNAAPIPTPLGHAPAGTQAVAGLSFALRPTDLVGSLTLALDGTPPTQVSVVACRATSRFTAAYGGAWSKVPSYDASSCVQGTLVKSSVRFADVSTLVDNGRLAIVVLPGPLDRVVFARPDRHALAVRHGIGVGPLAPPIGSGVTTPGPRPHRGRHHAGVTPPIRGGSVGLLPLLGTPPVPPGGPAPTSPTVAPPGTATPAAPTATAARPVTLATTGRRAVALGVIGVELAGFALLFRPARATAPGPANLAGVGPYRRERHGGTPHL